MTAQHFKRGPLTLSRTSDVSSLAVRRLEESLLLVPSMAPCENCAARAAEDLECGALGPQSMLRHSLSDHWLARRPDGPTRDARSPTGEHRNFRSAHSIFSFRSEGESSRTLAWELRATHSAVMGRERSSFRRSSIGVSADDDGTTVEFGDWNEIPALVDALEAQLKSGALPPATSAVTALAMILNIHPFVDGNGRVARATFNVFLNRGREGAYIPLRAFIDASDGGFEIRLREAEIFGRWTPLLEYFTDVFAMVRAHEGCSEHRPSAARGGRAA